MYTWYVILVGWVETTWNHHQRQPAKTCQLLSASIGNFFTVNVTGNPYRDLQRSFAVCNCIYMLQTLFIVIIIIIYILHYIYMHMLRPWWSVCHPSTDKWGFRRSICNVPWHNSELLGRRDGWQPRTLIYIYIMYIYIYIIYSLTVYIYIYIYLLRSSLSRRAICCETKEEWLDMFRFIWFEMLTPWSPWSMVFPRLPPNI